MRPNLPHRPNPDPDPDAQLHPDAQLYPDAQLHPYPHNPALTLTLLPNHNPLPPPVGFLEEDRAAGMDLTQACPNPNPNPNPDVPALSVSSAPSRSDVRTASSWPKNYIFLIVTSRVRTLWSTGGENPIRP